MNAHIIVHDNACRQHTHIKQHTVYTHTHIPHSLIHTYAHVTLNKCDMINAVLLICLCCMFTHIIHIKHTSCNTIHMIQHIIYTHIDNTSLLLLMY